MSLVGVIGVLLVVVAAALVGWLVAAGVGAVAAGCGTFGVLLLVDGWSD